jgi:4-amino-4-deoxy-L-arabinose transferase-like glycosyltransferase
LPSWWPLAALLVLAAALRLSTLDLQSFWYDEAYTPVHVLHAGLGATLRSVVHSENTPPLWYLLAWLDARVFGDGEIALRLPSALAGIATVAVAWGIGRELAGARAAAACAAIVAVNPLFVWYSQEARAYALFVLLSALAILCFLRARRQPTRGRMAAFALCGSLALLTHYFAVFLLAPMALVLLADRATRRPALPAVGVIAAVGAGLLPLIIAQGGHNTQWIGRWALSSRLQAIPQYFLTGYSGAPLGHSVEVLIAVPIIALLALGVARLPTLATAGGRARSRASPSVASPPRDGGREAWVAQSMKLALLLAGVGILAPIVLAALGADYLAPRNLVAAMIPVCALIAVAYAAGAPDRLARVPRVPAGTDGRAPGGASLPRTGPAWAGDAAVGLIALTLLAFLAVSVDVDLSPRLQRGNWRGLAQALREGSGGQRAITTVELGAAPLEYYLAPLHNAPRGAQLTLDEIAETGYQPLRRSAGRAPAPGFKLVQRRDIDGLILYRFRSAGPRSVSESRLRRRVITRARPEVLITPGQRGRTGQTGA